MIAEGQHQQSFQHFRKHYQQMWQYYSQGVQASSLIQLDYLVVRRAFKDGQSRKDIALMLTAGSLHVAQIHQEQGKDKARTYINQTVGAACQQEQERKLTSGKQKERQLEL